MWKFNSCSVLFSNAPWMPPCGSLFRWGHWGDIEVAYINCRVFCHQSFHSEGFQSVLNNSSYVMEGSSLTFSSGTGVPVGVDILACNGWNLNVKTILSSFGIHLPDKEKNSLLPCIVARYQHQSERPSLTKKSKNFPPMRHDFFPKLLVRSFSY